MQACKLRILLAGLIFAPSVCLPQSHKPGLTDSPALLSVRGKHAPLNLPSSFELNDSANIRTVSGVGPSRELKCSVEESSGLSNTSPEFERFLPTCIKHLRGLVSVVDHSYTDIQLQTNLEYECEHAKNFPLTYEDGFKKHKHCQDFACLVVSAREVELADGSTFAYKRACEMYWMMWGPKPPAPKPTKSVEPKLTSAPPVSTTLWCIINLTLQYFVLYTALAVVRTLVSFKFDLVGVQQILESACTTVTYAPMLSVLFLGVRMRAIQLTQGETEKYQLPQPWVQTAMIVSSLAVVAQAALVLVVGILSGTSKATTDADGNLDVAAMGDSSLASKLLTVVRYIVMAMLYAGFTVVVVGVCIMEPPKDIWGQQEVPVSPAVMCTILLSGMFFLIYLLVAITKTCFELFASLRYSRGLLKLEASATSAKMTVNFAPMLCILFVGARQRALQIDPRNGNPQSWAQKCFFMCTFSVLLQAVLAILLPFVTRAECRRGVCEGDISFSMGNRAAAIVMTVIRYTCLLALYGGVAAVVYSVFVIKHPTRPEETPPVSPAMHCVINLTVQYFFVYIMLFVCITIKSFVSGQASEVDAEAQVVHERYQPEGRSSKIMSKLIAIFDAARGTVMFAPMLAILFIGARMRALQLTRTKDGSIPPQAGPQKWVQEAMFLTTWAVFVQLVMTMLIPFLTGVEKPEVDKDGSVKVPHNTHKAIAIFAEFVRYLNLVFVYGGAMVVVVGIFTMTPDTLPPYDKHSHGLVPGVNFPAPPVPASANGL